MYQRTHSSMISASKARLRVHRVTGDRLRHSAPGAKVAHSTECPALHQSPLAMVKRYSHLTQSHKVAAIGEDG